MPQTTPPSPAAQYDLVSFDLSDMIHCGQVMRGLGESAASMEATALAIVRFLHASMVDAHTGERSCALVRCFKTHRFSHLPPKLAEIARTLLLDKQHVEPSMPCLTLLATAGDRPEWDDRRQSVRHAVIPLETADIVRRAPMIASLLRQMGIGIEAAMSARPELFIDEMQRAFNVFHVEDAVGDPSVPAQKDFVEVYGIRSVLGFGGLLPTGELFAVIMFSRTQIPRATANMFRTIALGVKLALLPHTRGVVFAPETGLDLAAAASPLAETTPGEIKEERLRSEAATLRMLMPALEAAALHQTRRLELAFADLQKQEEQVRQQSVRLRAMLEATTDAVFLLDREWRFTFLNNHAQALVAQGEDLLGANIWKVLPEAADTALWINYQKVMNEGLSVQFQEYYPAPIDRSFEVHAFPIEEGMAAFFHDITGRLKTEATLRQTEKLAATGRLAASIAHEINNPLESVTNLLYLLAHDNGISEKAAVYVQQAEQELQRVSEITTHMLRFYRQSTSPSDVRVEEVLESVLVLFQGRLAQACIEVKKRYGSTRRLRSFAGELRQIFANLVANSIDACREGDRLMLRVREAHDQASGVAGVRVTVADTGKGMSSAVRARLFEPFFTTKGITGTGLGLWVSLELIEKHGGTVRVRSAEASGRGAMHGAVFSVFFPWTPVVDPAEIARNPSIMPLIH